MALGVAAGFALSFAMESLQAWLPPRDANVVDLVANTLGALAGGAARGRDRAPPRDARDSCRADAASLFLPGVLGDVGLALLALWLAAQINPAIPLFAIAFDPAPERTLAGALPEIDTAAAVIEAAESAFQVLGVGPLPRAAACAHRRHAGGRRAAADRRRACC